jgi:hypothetical protein
MATLSTIEHPAEVPARLLRPYPPSWVDRLTAWVDRRPGPAWAYYLGAWLVFFLIESAVKWLDGSYPERAFPPYYAFLTGIGVAGLALTHYLDRSAAHALHTFRGILIATEAEYADLLYRITTLPARPTFLANSSGIMIGAFLLFGFSSLKPLGLFSSPLAVVTDSLFLLLAWAGGNTLIYHIYRQLRIVNHIYSTRTRVDLFDPGPIYALSGLTARSAITLNLVMYVWLATQPAETRFSPVNLLALIAWAVVTLGVFIGPLLGIHQRLQEEKDRLLAEVGQRVKALVAEAHRRVDTGEPGDTGALHNLMETLLSEQALLARIPTWPWRAETVQLVLTAVLLPVVLWLIQRLLDSIIGF